MLTQTHRLSRRLTELPPSALDVLERARDWIESEARWCQGALARPGEGRIHLHATSVLAERRSLTGAILWASQDLPRPERRKPFEFADACARAWGCRDLADLNDARTHAEMSAFLDDVIKLVREE